ncbi:MAG: hypothetical protein M3071_17575 [Actinomycetota bacterium]|nr:hypothetical protein [Actinomycetota bacterium]
MRPLQVLLGPIAVLALGALLGIAPAASGDGRALPCPQTTPAPQSTSTTTTPTSTTPAPPVIPQPTGDPLNNVTVENCHDATVEADSSLQLASVHATNGQPSNFAYAYAHDCSTGCQAIAVAFQVALVADGATVQAPQNVALAINYQCNGCGVFAYAYQYVVDVPKGARLSSATLHQIAMIRQQAQADVAANLTFADLDTDLQALAAQLRSTVDQGLKNQNVPETDEHSSEHLKQSGQG